MKTQPVASPAVVSNALNLHHSFHFLEQVVRARIQLHFCQQANEAKIHHELELAYYQDGSILSNFMHTVEPTFEEYVILLLALAPHVRPDFLDRVIKEALPDSGDYPELGGVRDAENRGFLPTGETALFLLAGADLEQRFEVQRILTADHWFARENILRLEPAREGQPYWSGRLLLDPEY
ncbi:MAG: AAA family ATPase, partial [Chloroflexi bacterium]